MDTVFYICFSSKGNYAAEENFFRGVGVPWSPNRISLHMGSRLYQQFARRLIAPAVTSLDVLHLIAADDLPSLSAITSTIKPAHLH